MTSFVGQKKKVVGAVGGIFSKDHEIVLEVEDELTVARNSCIYYSYD
jgi:hypothetical protein